MATKKWILHPALTQLLNQINEKYPKRSKRSDGTIGDITHKNTKSDHNPNKHGFVCALDLTHDPKNGFDAGELAETLRKAKDPRIKYVIFNRRIFNSKISPWMWRNYNGLNSHKTHIHISVIDFQWAI